jgi:hypothetical protein
MSLTWLTITWFLALASSLTKGKSHGFGVDEPVGHEGRFAVGCGPLARGLHLVKLPSLDLQRRKSVLCFCRSLVLAYP